MSTIYQPSGKAREYAPLAANLYVGCTHGCTYCYGPGTMKMSREHYHKEDRPRKDIIKLLRRDAEKLRGDSRQIHLSFIGDPYNPKEMEFGITRQAIKILIQNDLCFTILTKGGRRAVRDFDLLERYKRCSFGSTIVLTSQEDADTWEPNAPPINDRIDAVKEAWRRGIKTWISLEPVIDPPQALQLIKDLDHYVDHWKVGKINYHKSDVDWIEFRDEVKALLNELGASYYLKDSLTAL